MPDLTAGCYLADTATPDAVQAAWDALDAAYDADAESEFAPITYVNSSAALKAFCGARGGVVCTSGNAPQVLQWAFSRRPRVFFFPDQHLGRNMEVVDLADDTGSTAHIIEQVSSAPASTQWAIGTEHRLVHRL